MTVDDCDEDSKKFALPRNSAFKQQVDLISEAGSGIRGQIFVGKLFLLVIYNSLPLPSFILAKYILTSQIMLN